MSKKSVFGQLDLNDLFENKEGDIYIKISYSNSPLSASAYNLTKKRQEVWSEASFVYPTKTSLKLSK